MYNEPSVMGGEPKSLEVISALVRITADHIRGVYRFIYPGRDQIVSRNLYWEPATLANMQGVFRMICNRATMRISLALPGAAAYSDRR